ncbi:MAG: Fe-S protein assembly co-chaperone HscB [Polyangia bacterium]|jgi:molecular chaperone HscB
MICWSCQKAAGDGIACSACGAVQPVDAKADYFAVLGLAPAFDLDLAEAEHRYKERTKLLHPDRYARADARARRASLERSVQLNEAWRTLSDPVRRAEYLLLLRGVHVGEAVGTGSRDSNGGHTTLPVPQVLLIEVLELREALALAVGQQDRREVVALVAKVRARLDAVMAEVGKGFMASPPDLAGVAARLVSVRYYRRFLDDAARACESLAAGSAEVPHAG